MTIGSSPREEGIVPSKPLTLAAKYTKSAILPIVEGKFPVNWLLSILNVIKFVKLPNSDGIWPVSLLPCSCNVSMPYREPRELGIVPSNLLPFKFNLRTGNAPDVQATPDHVHTSVEGVPTEHSHPFASSVREVRAAEKSHIAEDSDATTNDIDQRFHSTRKTYSVEKITFGHKKCDLKTLMSAIS